MNGLYNNGPFQAGIAYEVHNNFRPNSVPVAGSAFPGQINPDTNQITGLRLQDQGLSVAASWNFGVVKVGGVFERLKYDVASGDIMRNFWGGSVTWNLGPGQLYAMYGQAQNGSGSALDGQQVGAVRKGANTGAQQWEVSYTYALSKRTLMYAGYVQIANRSNGAYNFGVNQISGACLPTNGQITARVRRLGEAARPQHRSRPLLLRGQTAWPGTPGQARATCNGNGHLRVPVFLPCARTSVPAAAMATGSICP